MSNEELIKQFVDVVFERVGKQISKQLNNTNIEFSSLGVVKTVFSDESSAIVDLGYVVTDKIPNLSGEELVEGAVVKVFYDKNDMRNAYIGVRFKNKE